jgi:beta-galactosidase
VDGTVERIEFKHYKHNQLMKTLYNLCFLLLVIAMPGCTRQHAKREVMSLNGKWEFAESRSFNEIPAEFNRTAPVPGLVDMASPAPDTPYVDKVYWYRKTFKMNGSLPELAMLKIHKSMYHTTVFLNKKPLGENYYCFTPSYFNIKELLNPKGIENELIIGIGCHNNMPDTVLNGHDQERINYIPGIYDQVEILLTGYPYIANIQTAPDTDEKKVRIQALFDRGGQTGDIALKYQLSEVSTGNVVLQGDTAFSGNSVDFKLAVPSCRLWSPEDPFLYEISMSTPSDNKKVKFGMRSFRFDPENKVAILNGKPYYMRGTNIAIQRFFEDSQRGSLPWDYAWVARLHSRFKEMHWNSMRYCIGFPPERWYEIADSVGFLIQDEFPLWWGMRNVKAVNLVPEYTAWMKERWNHPCVVIWDAQNETVTEETGKAIHQVRGLDLSNRPWDNGWGPPQAATDGMETHPYLMEFLKPVNGSNKAPWTDLYTTVRIPQNGPSDRFPAPDGKPYPNPIIINEYEWLWMNRDGTPTTLTDDVYKLLLGANSTKEQRYDRYARILAMDTEYWRAHRKCAGVLYFTGLGYSRSAAPRGQTCDNFTDVKNLVFEPNFEKFMKPAFAPVGVMVDVWNAKYKRNSELVVPVYITNDQYSDFSDSLKLTLMKDQKVLQTISQRVTVKSLGQEITEMKLSLPMTTGNCILTASILNGTEIVTSVREIELIP